LSDAVALKFMGFALDFMDFITDYSQKFI